MKVKDLEEILSKLHDNLEIQIGVVREDQDGEDEIYLVSDLLPNPTIYPTRVIFRILNKY